MDEVTGSGFKERVLMVKGNKYCRDKSRAELTDGERLLLLPSAACLLSNPPPLSGRLKLNSAGGLLRNR